jgi:hypothetical protein
MQYLHPGVNAILALKAECNSCIFARMQSLHNGQAEKNAPSPECIRFMQDTSQGAKMFRLLRANPASLLSAKSARVSINYLSTT